MRITILLIFAFFLTLSASAIEIDTAKADSAKTYYREPNHDYIPAEADYDLIKDRLSCIENKIPLNYNNRVHAFVNYFSVKDREYTKMVIGRKNIYFPIFEKYLKKYGLPEELKYLSIIESGLNPQAVSPARAVGLWQFMPRTGSYFGLRQDWYLDERMDPEKSTEAACRYLSQLYNMFGDWELAISAYNTGPGNIRKAIRKSGYKRSFWDIYPYLYRETRSYLPQFVAMIYVLNYADEHNFLEEELDYAVETDTLLVKDYMHLETLANQINLCNEDLLKLNSGLKRGVIPKSTKGVTLNIPADLKETINKKRHVLFDSASKVGKEQLNYLSRNSIGSTYGRNKVTHTVRRGDVIGIIAESYKVRIADIRRWNNLRGNTIRIGQKLNIWIEPGNKPSYVRATPSINKLPDGSKSYIVQPGDTLWDISRKFDGLSIEKLKTLNKLQTNNIKPGQTLVLGK